MDSEPAASGGRLPRRACRRRAVLCALSDALVPLRSRGAGRRDQRAGGALRRGRAAPADGGSQDRCAPCPSYRTHAPAARAARQGFGAGRAHLAGIFVAPHRRDDRTERHHHQRLYAAAGSLRARKAGHLLFARTGRRAWLGLWRSARRQARLARFVRGVDAGRRLLHVRQSDGRTLGRRASTRCRS